MALLDILCFPDERLRSKAKKVENLTKEYQTFIDDMLQTMYAAPGIGLAATQVNRHEQIIVIDVSEDKTEPCCFINPEIISSSGVEKMEEGCLSVPETYAEIERAESVVVKYMDRKGNEQILHTSDMLAVCIQHEIDHLQGKLFVDYLSKLKRDRIRKKLAKHMKQKL